MTLHPLLIREKERVCTGTLCQEIRNAYACSITIASRCFVKGQAGVPLHSTKCPGMMIYRLMNDMILFLNPIYPESCSTKTRLPDEIGAVVVPERSGSLQGDALAGFYHTISCGLGANSGKMGSVCCHPLREVNTNFGLNPTCYFDYFKIQNLMGSLTYLDG